MRIKPSQKSYQRRRIGGGEDKKFPVGMGREKWNAPCVTKTMKKNDLKKNQNFIRLEQIFKNSLQVCKYWKQEPTVISC